MVAVANQPSELQVQIQSLSRLVSDGQTFRVQLDSAKQEELSAFRTVQHLQSKILTLLASPEARDGGECLDMIAGLRVRLGEAERKWRTCVEATGILRERLGAIAQEAGEVEDSNSGSGALMARTGEVSPSPMRGRLAALPVASPSLHNSKPVPVRSCDIGAAGRAVPPMVRPAYPPVDPRFGYNPALPSAELTEERLRAQFDALDTNHNGVLSVEELEQLFNNLGTFGIPGHSRKFIEQTLRRSGVLDDDKVTYGEFSILMLKWVSL